VDAGRTFFFLSLSLFAPLAQTLSLSLSIIT